MKLDAVMTALEAKGKPNTAKIYQRHGVADACYGVSHAELDALAKKLRPNHDLALALWGTKIHDARVLATKIADAPRMTREEIEGWLNEAKDYVITDAAAQVAAGMPQASELARSWIESDSEWVGSAGWNVVAALAMREGLSAEEAKELIARICATIHAAKNRTRYSMNNALIAIGGSIEPLRATAIDAARVIGAVAVDHGQTGCKTPDAATYIERMAAHASKKKGGRAQRSSKATKAVRAESASKAGKADQASKPAAKVDQASKPAAKAEKASKPAAKASKPAAKAEKASRPAAKAEKASRPAAKAEKASRPAAKAEKASKPAAKAEKASRPAAKAEKASKPAARRK